ncbi:hypothetical protein [Methanobrevibacter sp.]
MNSQGFFGALWQYWDIQPKVRLNRRNTFFDEEKITNYDALRFSMLISIVSLSILIFWSILGVVL